MNLVDPLSIYALWLRDVKRFLRSPSRIVGSVAMPLLLLLFLGYGFSGAAIPGLPEGVDYLQYLVPGMVGFTMLFGASFAGLSILSDQASRRSKRERNESRRPLERGPDEYR